MNTTPLTEAEFLSLGQNKETPRISRSLPSLREEGITEKRTRFIATVHELFHESVAKRSKENTSEWKKLWKKHALVRTAVGITLAGWAIAATASGAGVLAAGLLATRAIMGAVGGYVAVEWLFDTFGPRLRKHGIDALLQKIDTAESIQELDPYINKAIEQIELDNLDKEIEKSKLRNDRFNTVKRFTAATACAALAIIGGSRMAEAATLPYSASLSSASVVNPVQQTLPFSSPTASHDIHTIMQDVQHDHPKQGCITLEQCVRRIEGLKQGIPLDQSEKLCQLNKQAFDITRDPHGPVVTAMKELGYINDQQTVDEVAKHLKPKDIQWILEQACGSQENNLPSVSQDIGGVSGAHLDKWIPLPHQTEVQDSVISSDTLHTESSNTTGALIAASLLGAGAALYAQRKKFNAKSQQEVPKGHSIKKTKYTKSHRLPREQKPGPDSTQDNRDFFQEVIPSREGTTLHQIRQEIAWLSQEEQNIIMNQLSECPDAVRDRMARVNVVAYVIGQKLGFFLKNASLNSDVFGNLTYSLPTIGWEYVIQFIQEAWRAIGITFAWLDHGQMKYQNGKKMSELALSNIAKFSQEIKHETEDLFMEAIVSREIVKQQELRDVHTFEITKSDLQKIYGQLENTTHTRRGDSFVENETGGAWFQWVYGIRDWVFRFQNLTNPRNDELLATPWEFNIHPDKMMDWIMRGMMSAESVSRSEKIIREKLENMDGGRFGRKFRRIDGHFSLFNWHKHPDGLPHPSSMDIRDSAIDNGFARSPNRLMWSWGIVTVIDHIPAKKPPNTLYLTREEFGGRRNYQITFWKLVRWEREAKPVKIRWV